MRRDDQAAARDQVRPFPPQLGALSRISRKGDGPHVWILRQEAQGFREEPFGFRVVVVGLGCGRPQSYENRILRNSQIAQNLGIGHEAWDVYVFLESRILQRPLGILVYGVDGYHVRRENPIRPYEAGLLTVFVVMYHDAWDAQQLADKGLSTRAVRERKARVKPGG